MSKTKTLGDIRYFGSDICHGHQGPLPAGQCLTVYEGLAKRAFLARTLTVADLVAASDNLTTPVSYTVLPS